MLLDRHVLDLLDRVHLPDPVDLLDRHLLDRVDLLDLTMVITKCVTCAVHNVRPSCVETQK